MPRNLLKFGSRWLERQRTKHATEEVVLQRGSSSVTVRATLGGKGIQVDNGDGLVTEVQPRDFLILAADYLVNDVPVEPKGGDRIITGDQLTGDVYEVMAESNVPAFEWSDEFNDTYRVHTKFVGTLPL